MPRSLAVQLLRIQYWFDRLDDGRRVLAALALLGFVAAGCLYILGIGSTIIVSRMSVEEPVAAVTTAASPVARTPPSRPATPTIAIAAVNAPPTATPDVVAAGDLIEPPAVRELTLLPRPPEIEPLKPRMLSTPPPVATPVVANPQASPVLPRPAAPAASPATGPAHVTPAAPTGTTSALPTATPLIRPPGGTATPAQTPAPLPTTRVQTMTPLAPTPTPRAATPAGPTSTPFRR